MNKRYFTALIAMFLMAVSAIAQSNTYNMVLTLKDGTVITIGPNDLKQLDFVEGNITASGTNITDLMKQMQALQTSLVAMQNEVAAAVAQIKNNKAELKADISNLAKSVASQIEVLQDNMTEEVNNKIQENKAELMEYTDAAKEVITNEYHEAIDHSKAELMALINALQPIIGQNTDDIEKNTADIAKNKTTISTNTKNIKKIIEQLMKVNIIIPTD